VDDLRRVRYLLEVRGARQKLRVQLMTTPVYCATCDIEHDQPQDCPEHDDYEPVRGLDRYPDVKVSDLADND